jgi:pyruvate dehydrogenase E2 component (dihydrolipoamide acetyltransferase)
MAQIITMPRLSDTMTEGVVATWLKKVGDTIKTGDILAEIETDKATMEFESFHDGVLLHIGIQEGQSAPVDSLLAIVGKSGEDISALLSSGTASENKDEKVEVKEELPTPSSQLPANVKVVTMPRLSDTMTTGTVATWLKKVGDTVKEGDILAEIETDKATMEFESFNSGTLLYIGIQEGDSAPVDAVLAILGPAGTDVSKIAANYKVETTNNQQQTTNNTDRIFASPLAKKIAHDKGINLSQVSGSGENGRIVKSDVENFTPRAASFSNAVADGVNSFSNVKPFVPTGEVFKEEITNSQMRKTIAKRLSESKFTAPHYYLTIELDMDNAIASRNMINGLPETKISFNDMVIKASAMALKKHPQVNSQWREDAMVINHHVNIGVAVAVEDGLMVPVLKFTDEMSLTQIGATVKDLAGKAKSRKIQPAEMEGSTFTISNLGMFGIQSFTSIINQPNSAILSVGAIIEKPVVKKGQIVVGNTMTVTLACDHRTVDGATGAQFLQTFKAFMENPFAMFV